MEARRPAGIFGLAALLLPLAALVLLAVTGTPAALLAQYQVDILFPAFHPPEGLSVSNALWLVMLGKVALLAFVTVLEKLPDGADPRWPHTLACRLAAVAVVLYIVEAALGIGLVRGLSPIISAADSISQALRGTGQALILVRNHTAVAAGLLLSLAALGFTYARFRHHRFSAGLAAAAGILGVAGAFWPYMEVLNTLRNAGYLLFLAWCGMTGIIYLRRKL